MKATHKQLVDLFLQMDYVIYEEISNLNITTMYRSNEDIVPYITIKDSTWYNGVYNDGTGEIEEI